MLILTRNRGERIFINGDEIKISICGVQGQQVRVGIDAPKSVTVNREEIYDRIQTEGKIK